MAGAGRAARRPRPVGPRRGVLLRLRRPDRAGARRGGDAVAGGRRAGHRLAHLRARAGGADRAGAGGGGAAAAGRDRCWSCPRSTSTTRPARAPFCITWSGRCSSPTPSRSQPAPAAPWSPCWRPAESGPRPSSSPPRCLSCSARACPPAEIAVVYRSRAAAAPLVARVFGAVRDRAERRPGRPSSATPRWAGRCSAPPAARCWRPRRRPPDDLLAYLRAPGLLHTPEVADALEADVRREGLRTAAQARERLGWEFDELDELAAAAESPRPGRRPVPGRPPPAGRAAPGPGRPAHRG